MKIGINLAAATLRQNVHELILSSNCPAVIVRATLEDELRAVREWEAEEVKKERQQLQQQLTEEENTQAPADQPDAATEQED
jgi:hypothetical protein